MAVGADVLTHRPAPEAATWEAGDFFQNVPECDVNSSNRRGTHDAVAVPKVLAVHHLPKMLDPRRILTDDQLGEVLDRTDNRSRVPFERRFAPAEQAILVGEDFDKDPVPHP